VNKEMTSDVVTVDVMSDTTKNFPIRSFYSEVTKNVTTFYRLGQCVTNCPKDPESRHTCEKMYDQEFGNMFLIYDKALLV